jgi:hypothetical protein
VQTGATAALAAAWAAAEVYDITMTSAAAAAAATGISGNDGAIGTLATAAAATSSTTAAAATAATTAAIDTTSSSVPVEATVAAAAAVAGDLFHSLPLGQLTYLGVLTGVVSACELVAINRYTQGYAVLAFGLIPITGRVVVTPGCQIGYMHGLPGVVDWCFYCKIT